MRYIIFALIVSIFLSCNSTGHKEYNKISSKEFITINVNTKGAILDTLPSWIKLVTKSYSLIDVNTSCVFLSDSETAYNFARLILDPKFGKSMMDSERPFKVELIDQKYWYIKGSSPKELTL